MGVIHEEPSHQVLLVAETFALDSVGEQEQARVLDASRCQKNQPRGHAKLVSRETRHAHGGCRASRLGRLDLDGVAVQAGRDVARAQDLCAIGAPETRRWAELVDGVHDAITRELQEWRVPTRPGFGLILVRPELADGLSPLIEGLEIGSANGPAAVRNPGTCLEIDFLERSAPADPVVGRTTEVAQARLNQRVREAHVLAGVERLALRVELEPPALQQQDPKWLIDELTRKGDARRTGTNDAHIGFQGSLVLNRSSIDQQVKVSTSSPSYSIRSMATPRRT